MPARVKVKSDSQSSDPSNIQIKSIQDINPEHVFTFSDKIQLFRKYFPTDSESETADKIFGLMEVLEHFRTYILTSKFLAPRDQITKCRTAFNKALSQHQTNSINARVSKSQLTPSAYIAMIPDILKSLISAFSIIDVEAMIKAFNTMRIEINTLVQTLSQLRQKLPTPDKDFHNSYSEFQKVKKTMNTQVNQLRDYHQSKRCTSLIAKNNYLLSHFKTLTKILNPKQSNLKDKGISFFNEITNYLLDVKAGLLGLNITQKIKHILKKLYKKKGLTDNLAIFESDDEEASNQSSEPHKQRNRRNLATNSKQSQKNSKTVEYEYEYEEEEEEEEEEIVVSQAKRGRRSNSRTEQVKKVDNNNNDNRRSRSTSRSNQTTSSTTNQRKSLQTRAQNNSSLQSSQTSSRGKRGGRGRIDSDDEKSSKTGDSSSAAQAAGTNRRTRSNRNTATTTSASSTTASRSDTSNASNGIGSRGRKGQSTTSMTSRFSELNSSQRGSKNSAASNEPDQLVTRRTRRRRSSDLNNDEDELNNNNNSKAKPSASTNASSSQSSKESGTYNTRSSNRSKEKEKETFKESQTSTTNASNSSTTATGSQGRGRGKSSISASSSATSVIETKAQEQERKMVYGKVDELTIPLLEIIRFNGESFLKFVTENTEEEGTYKEKEFPFVILNPFRDLYMNEQITEANFNAAFNKSWKEFKSFIESMNFELFPVKLFNMIHEIEVYKIINNITNKNIDQLIDLISNLPDKLIRYQQLQQIETILLDLLSNSEESSTNPFLTHIFEEMFSVFTLIIILIKSILPFNIYRSNIKNNKNNKMTRVLESLFIPYNNYLNRQSNASFSLHFQQFSPVPFKYIKNDEEFDSFIFNICKDIEASGIQILLNSNQESFNCLNIIVPRIKDLLSNIQESLILISTSINDNSINQISSNLLINIYDIGKVLEVEKTLCKLKNSPSLSPVFDFDSLLAMIKTFRDIHFLFVSLNGRDVISYSNALNLTYARMFVEQVCNVDILSNQILGAPIDPNKAIQIKNILNNSQNEFLEEKLRSSYLIRLKSFDYFPSKHFITLFNIENVKTLVLKGSSTTPSAPLYPQELTDLIYSARLKSRKVDEGRSINDEKIQIIKNIFGIDKGSFESNAKLSADSQLISIRALAEVYFDLLEMIAIRDQILTIPPSLSAFLSIGRKSPSFQEKIKKIENFKEIVLIFHNTFRINIVTIIDSIIKEIEQIIIPPPQTQQEQQQQQEAPPPPQQQPVEQQIEAQQPVEQQVVAQQPEAQQPVEQNVSANDNESNSRNIIDDDDDDDEDEEDKSISVEESEKMKALLFLSLMKRGYLSTLCVTQFVEYITNESNKLHDVFTQNIPLMKMILDLSKVKLFIDIHDKLAESMESLSSISILRNLNLSLFCSAITRSLLLLNTTMTISLTNSSNANFSVLHLNEINKYSKLVMSHMNEVDRYEKAELVETLRMVYPILPTSSLSIDLINDLSDTKLRSIEPEQKDRMFLKVSCLNTKFEIDDFIRFQSDPNKRNMKITSPIIMQAVNPTSTANNKKCIFYCVSGFDVPSSSSIDSGVSNAAANVNMKQQKRIERLKQVEEMLQINELQFIASNESLAIPIPCSLLSIGQQEYMADYYRKLQEEREELVIKEKEFQEFIKKKEDLLIQAQQQSIKRKELIDKFYSLRERLKQVTIKAQQQEEENKRNQEDNNNDNQELVNMKNDESFTKFENDAILTNQHNKNLVSIQKIQNDLINLEQRTKKSLEANHRFKNKIDQLSRKYDAVQDASSKTIPFISKSSSEKENFIMKDLTDVKIDDFVKDALVEMNLASEKTFEEIDKTVNEIKQLEEGTANEEAIYIIKERLRDIKQFSEYTPEMREEITGLLNDIMQLKKEKEKIQNNQI